MPPEKGNLADPFPLSPKGVCRGTQQCPLDSPGGLYAQGRPPLNTHIYFDDCLSLRVKRNGFVSGAPGLGDAGTPGSSLLVTAPTWEACGLWNSHVRRCRSECLLVGVGFPSQGQQKQTSPVPPSQAAEVAVPLWEGTCHTAYGAQPSLPVTFPGTKRVQRPEVACESSPAPPAGQDLQLQAGSPEQLRSTAGPWGPRPSLIPQVHDVTFSLVKVL